MYHRVPDPGAGGIHGGNMGSWGTGCPGSGQGVLHGGQGVPGVQQETPWAMGSRGRVETTESINVNKI